MRRRHAPYNPNSRDQVAYFCPTERHRLVGPLAHASSTPGKLVERQHKGNCIGTSIRTRTSQWSLGWFGSLRNEQVHMGSSPSHNPAKPPIMGRAGGENPGRLAHLYASF